MTQAIQTRYAGCNFRSRLEARWAVFFDALSIRWEYEPQGYHIGIWCTRERAHACRCMVTCSHPDGMKTPDGSGCRDATHRRKYLPDFYLPDTETWIEVKGSAKNIDWQLLADAVDYGWGLPGVDGSADPYQFGRANYDASPSMSSTRGLLLLGPIPQPPFVQRRIHPILQHFKGGWVCNAQFVPRGLTVTSTVGICDHHYLDSSQSSQDTEPWTKYVTSRLSGDYAYLDDKVTTDDRVVNRAYTSARSARFEYGQSGA